MASTSVIPCQIPYVGARLVSHHYIEDLDFYVALDSADLATLRKVIDRAEDKTKNMKALLDKGGLHYFAEGSR